MDVTLLFSGFVLSNKFTSNTFDRNDDGNTNIFLFNIQIRTKSCTT